MEFTIERVRDGSNERKIKRKNECWSARKMEFARERVGDGSNEREEEKFSPMREWMSEKYKS